MESGVADNSLMTGGFKHRRIMAAGFLAFVFAAAQLLFAGHSEDLFTHAPQSCEFCLAAAVSDDPDDAVVEVAPPVRSVGLRETLKADDIVFARAPIAPHSRAPPIC